MMLRNRLLWMLAQLGLFVLGYLFATHVLIPLLLGE
jgi:hypothetical protein